MTGVVHRRARSTSGRVPDSSTIRAMTSPPRTTTRSNRLLRAAFAAAAAGMHVFPVQPRAKVPAVRDWERVATRERKQLLAWWSQRPFNVGIAAGPSNLIVVDLDPGHGEPAPPPFAGAVGGADVLALLAARAGAPSPTDTYTVGTPSGGTHLYFRAPKDVELRNTQGALGWRIDTRAHGGFVVAAGSVGAAGPYRVIRRLPVAPLPAWLLAALASTAYEAPDPIDPVALPPARAAAYVRAIVEGEAAAVRGAATGSRHSVLLRAARTLGRLVGGGELAAPDARATLLEAGGSHVGVDGFAHAELERTIEDGLAYGLRRPRTVRRRP